jgi:hypothetical protein
MLGSGAGTQFAALAGGTGGAKTYSFVSPCPLYCAPKHTALVARIICHGVRVCDHAERDVRRTIAPSTHARRMCEVRQVVGGVRREGLFMVSGRDTRGEFGTIEIESGDGFSDTGARPAMQEVKRQLRVRNGETFFEQHPRRTRSLTRSCRIPHLAEAVFKLNTAKNGAAIGLWQELNPRAEAVKLLSVAWRRGLQATG